MMPSIYTALIRINLFTANTAENRLFLAQQSDWYKCYHT